jgi:hypothetical protein
LVSLFSFPEVGKLLKLSWKEISWELMVYMKTSLLYPTTELKCMARKTNTHVLSYLSKQSPLKNV